MKTYRFLSLFLAVVLPGLLLPPQQASALEDFDAQARAALLIEANTGEVLYEKNAHRENYPASVTKVMTALLVFEAVTVIVYTRKYAASERLREEHLMKLNRLKKRYEIQDKIRELAKEGGRNA